MYTRNEFDGMATSKQKRLDIYKYIKAEDGISYVSKSSYIANKGKPEEVFDKEHAKIAMFKFYFEGMTGPDLAEFFKSEETQRVGWANGRTITMLGFGIRVSDKETGAKADNQRGDLKGKVSAEEAQRMIDEIVEYVYE